jgi:RNA polymerase sigma-70 factor (ECF subfamily)
VADIACEDERRLLETLSAGDHEAFWPLWQQYREQMYSVCLRQMSGIHADAADAASRTMLVAWEKLPRSASEILSVKAWLTRLTCNVCFDMHRERRRRLRVADTLTTMMNTELLPAMHVEPSPERTAISAEICNQIRNAIDGLPPALREAAELRFLQDQSYETIALRAKITEANARKRVQQARELLAERLGHAITLRCTRLHANQGRTQRGSEAWP